MIGSISGNAARKRATGQRAESKETAEQKALKARRRTSSSARKDETATQSESK